MQASHPTDCLSVSSIKRWFNWFKSGQDRIQNLPKTGCPKKCTPEKIEQI